MLIQIHLAIAFKFGEQDILFQNFTWVSVVGAPFEIVFCSTNLKSKASKLNFCFQEKIFESFQDAVFIMLSVFFSTSYILLLRPFNSYEFEGVDYFTNLPHPYSHSYQRLANHCRVQKLNWLIDSSAQPKNWENNSTGPSRMIFTKIWAALLCPLMTRA